MSCSSWIRQIHRWLSILFTLTVIANIVIYAQGKTPPPWVTYAPLFPLGLLWLSGSYMFVRPYVTRWRGKGNQGI